MLQEAKPKFEKDVNDILKDATYKAFMNTFTSKGGDDAADRNMKKEIDANAKQFAEKFAEQVAKTLAVPLTDAIDEYIKASGLFINILPSGIALANAAGMVTGTITINPQTSNIEIK